MMHGRLSTLPGLHLNSYSSQSVASAGLSLMDPSKTISERSLVTLPNAPYVLTMRKGSKEVFMICREETRLVTMGALSTAMTAATAKFIMNRNALRKMFQQDWDRNSITVKVFVQIG